MHFLALFVAVENALAQAERSKELFDAGRTR